MQDKVSDAYEKAEREGTDFYGLINLPSDKTKYFPTTELFVVDPKQPEPKNKTIKKKIVQLTDEVLNEYFKKNHKTELLLDVLVQMKQIIKQKPLHDKGTTLNCDDSNPANDNKAEIILITIQIAGPCVGIRRDKRTAFIDPRFLNQKVIDLNV